MPTSERTSISLVKPSGWHTIKYEGISGKYLYNRCHLIGYQLTGENDNENNLITCTRYMNVEGMLPFENMIADYIKETNNHVLYRVTPIFKENNLLASGALLEAISVEDNGDGIKFNVYCYNVQPNIYINYEDGTSYQLTSTTNSSQSESTSSNTTDNEVETYILNTNTKKFHKSNCSLADTIKEENKSTYTGSREDLINQGYEACKKCNP